MTGINKTVNIINFQGRKNLNPKLWNSIRRNVKQVSYCFCLLDFVNKIVEFFIKVEEYPFLSSTNVLKKYIETIRLKKSAEIFLVIKY